MYNAINGGYMFKNNFIIGFIFIFIGIVLILNKILALNFFYVNAFWPLFILIPGIILEGSFFLTKKTPVILLPGAILTLLGLLFSFENFTNWSYCQYTWPIYPLSLALGLLQLYYFGSKQKILLLPAAILAAISIISFGSMLLNGILSYMDISLIIPIILILIGAFVLFKGNNNKHLY
jgi:hypothetical protein